MYPSTTQGSGGGMDKARKELSPEELQHLLNKLSSDETKELQDTMKKCTSEVMLTRGVPVTGLILGSLYVARTRLPTQYHFGPKGWPFYAIMGIGSLTFVNVMSMGKCKERMTPLIDQYWNKYQSMDNKNTTYDHIRQQHRAGLTIPETQYAYPAETTYDTIRRERRGEDISSSLDSYDPNQQRSGFSSSMSSYGSELSNDQQYISPRRPVPPIPEYSEPTFMSGTPSGRSGSRPTEREFS